MARTDFADPIQMAPTRRDGPDLPALKQRMLQKRLVVAVHDVTSTFAGPTAILAERVDRTLRGSWAERGSLAAPVVPDHRGAATALKPRHMTASEDEFLECDSAEADRPIRTMDDPFDALLPLYATQHPQPRYQQGTGR